MLDPAQDRTSVPPSPVLDVMNFLDAVVLPGANGWLINSSCS